MKLLIDIFAYILFTPTFIFYHIMILWMIIVSTPSCIFQAITSDNNLIDAYKEMLSAYNLSLWAIKQK